MQNLARGGLSADAVRALLTADSVIVSAGLDLLDDTGAFVRDISDDLEGGTISRDNFAVVHGSCRLQITRELNWGKDRVRPYMVVSDGFGGAQVRFNLGVYVLTTPDTVRGEVPATYDVVGYDLLHLLQDGPSDTYVIEPAGSVLNAWDFEVDVSGWDSNPSFGAYTPAISWTRSTTRASGGAASMQVVLPNAPTHRSWVNNLAGGMTLGKTYKITADVWVPTGGPNVGIDILFRSISPAQNVAKDQWVTLEMIWVADTDWSWFGVYADAPTGQTIWVDNVKFEALSSTYFDGIKGVLGAAGITAPLNLPGDRLGTIVARDMAWALPEQTTWLEIINDLLAEIGYDDVYADMDGRLRSQPYVSPDSAPVEWTLDTSNPATNIVGEDRTVAEDVWDAYNWWRFVRTRMDYQPVEGDGLYTPSNMWDGPTSWAALGRWRRAPVQYLEAADQEALVAQGDRIVAEDRAVLRTVTLDIDPLPAQAHRDMFRLIDAGVSEKLVASGWTLNLDNSGGRLTLGGDRSLRREPTDTQAIATVTANSTDPGGLRVVVDGATQDSRAMTLDGAAYTIGQRVTVQVRNPSPPLVMGEES